MPDDPRSRILAEARACLGMGGPEPWATEAGIRGASKGVSWCGLFVRAVWRRAGLIVRDWKIGDGNVAGLKRTTTPEPGDLVCWRGATGHQSIFVGLDGSIVQSIDGNTTGRGPDGTPVYSTIAEKRRPLADVLFFCSAPVASASAGPVPSPAGGSTRTGLPLATDLCRGLDVSSHQDPKALNWAAAARLGYRYGIVRLTNGVDLDDRAHEHARRIRDAGLVLGAYGFLVPWHSPERLASAFTAAAELVQYGHPGDLIPWLDVESWQGASGYHQAEPSWSPVAEETARLLAQAFGGCAVYVNAADWASMGRPMWIGRHPLACAHYTDAAEPLTAGGLQWTWWQHRVAVVPGVATVRLDQSLARLPLPTIPSPSAEPLHLEQQRVDVGWIGVPWDRAEHDRLRNAAVARHTAREPL